MFQVLFRALVSAYGLRNIWVYGILSLQREFYETTVEDVEQAINTYNIHSQYGTMSSRILDPCIQT